MGTTADVRTDELRLALVLNGGVSLAVWMGGVVFELNRLVRETHPVYRGLLELTGTAARIDVISGTSAGGVNGAALALAQIYDQGLYTLRDVWLDTGGLDNLLQDPDAPDLRALLRGDDWFLPRIRDAFARLVGEQAAPADLVPVNLSLTTTLLDGQSHRSMDDFGAEIEDTVHRAVWRFPHLSGDDVFTGAQVIDQLAFAARSTASFPVAFEPAQFQPASPTFAGTQRLYARTGGATAITDKAFLLDGGILDNKPFEAALEGISKLPAEGNTRRVLAYVVPDPAASAEKRQADRDGVLDPPTLAQAAWRSLVSIPGAQSIGSHMAELRSHNDSTARRWKRLIGAVVNMQAGGLLACAGVSITAYKARRVDGMIDYFLEETERQLSAVVATAATAPGATPDAGPKLVTGMRRATRRWLASVWRTTAQPAIHSQGALGPNVLAMLGRFDAPMLDEIHRHWAARIPRGFDPSSDVVAQPRWAWGLYALQFAADFAIEVLRRTQRLRALVSRWEDLGRGKVDAAPLRSNGSPSFDFMKMDRERSEARQRLLDDKTRLSDIGLKGHWQTAYGLAEDIAQRRRAVDRAVGAIGKEGFVALIQAWQKLGGEQPPEPEALKLLTQLLKESDEAALQGHAFAERLFMLLHGLRGHLEEVLTAHAARRGGPGRIDIDEAVEELRAIHRFLYGTALGPVSPDVIAWRVMALEVFEVTAGSRRQTPGAQAEIVQISARLSSAFGGSDDPAQRLNGMQLAHFGAFYKRSWRANDWTFGCLDGIDRAIRIALNPDALQKRFGHREITVEGHAAPLNASEYVRLHIHGLAVATAEPDLVDYLAERWDEARIVKELAWLDEPTTVPPPVLEECARALTRRLQMETLRRELPEIARSLWLERASGAPPSEKYGVPLMVKVAPTDPLQIPPPLPETAEALIRADLLGHESLADELGSDQLTRTASQGLATAHAALSSKYGGVDALKVLLKLTEWPLRIFYWLANRLLEDSKTAAAVQALALGVGAALVIGAGLGTKFPGEALAFGWALLVGSLATVLMRSRSLGLSLIVAVAIAMYMYHPGSLGVFLGAGLAMVLVLLPGGALWAMLLIVVVAAWWSAGGSVEALKLLRQEYWPWASNPAPAAMPDAAAAKAAAEELKLLKAALGPALALAVLLVAIAALRWWADALDKLRHLGK